MIFKTIQVRIFKKGNILQALPKIETKRLLLSSFTSADVDDVYEYASNPRVAKYTSWSPHESKSNSEAWLALVFNNQSITTPNLVMPWSIRLNNEPKVIGCVEFAQVNENTGRVDYVLSEPYWRKGIMGEAVTAVIQWVFQNLPDITTIISGALTENRASCNLLERVGMDFSGYEKVQFDKHTTEQEASTFVLRKP